MGEKVDTRGLELKILETKTKKIEAGIQALASRIQTRETDVKESFPELKKYRKELVDCVTLELGTPIIGPIVASRTIEIITQLDELIFKFELLSLF